MQDFPVIESEYIWETPLFFSALNGFDENNQELKALIFSGLNQSNPVESGVAESAKKHLFESSLDFLQQEFKPVQELKSCIEQHLITVLHDLNASVWPEDANPQVEIVESWFHLTENGGYHDVHSHPNCSWCGIYCVQAGQSDISSQNGVNRFYDPRNNAAHYMDAGNMFLHEEGFWDVAPVDGQLVLFPSYLKHSALPYFGKDPRIVIAFNAQIHFV